MNHRTSTAALVLLGLAAAGCDEPTGTSPGELGNGAFTYACTGTTDPWCETPFQFRGAPRLALDASFTVSYDDVHHAKIPLEPAAPAMLAWSRGRYAFLHPGPVALLARDGQGVVRDFLHLHGEPVADLELVRIDPAQLEGRAPDQRLNADPWALEALDQLVLGPPSAAHLFGFPIAADGEILAGSLPWGFTPGPEGIIDVRLALGDNVVEVVPLAAGETTLQVRAGAFVREFPVVVEVGP